MMVIISPRSIPRDIRHTDIAIVFVQINTRLYKDRLIKKTPNFA